MLGFVILLVVGLSVVTASPVVGPQIVGGENTTQGEFPFLVLLKKDGIPFCDGSLISDQWVLTAAQCVLDYDYDGDTDVYYGNNRLHDRDLVYPNTVSVVEAIRHPNFTTKDHHGSLFVRNDVGLLKLEHPLNFSANVQAIKLPQQNQAVPVNHSATLIGWGDTNIIEVPNILQKVNLTIYDYPYCESYNRAKNFSDAQNFCAGNDNNTKGQCTGDSGGPLFIDDVQWGIVSWSIKPCISAPGVFTTTSVFVDWINSVIESY